MSKPDLVCVDPARVEDFWPYVRERLRIAIERTGLSDFTKFESDILQGRQLLWLAWDNGIEAVATTELSKAGQRTICTLTACEGHQRERWLPLFEQIEQYAKDEDADLMRIYGRVGWQRVLEGYKPSHAVLEKSLK